MLEHSKYNEKLHHINSFPVVNKYKSGFIASLILSFNFRSVSFNKKKALPFFLAMELISNQKSVASLSGRDVQAWKLRKGRLVGCKVTLRNKSMFTFLNTLSVTIPRMEKYKVYTNFEGYHKKEKKISFNLSVKELIQFSSIENTLGNHPDLKKMRISFVFSTKSKEEQYFIIRYYKLPILYLNLMLVAQLDRASDYGSESCEFNSCQAW